MQYSLNADGSELSLSGEFTFADHAAFLEVTARLFASSASQVTLNLARLDFIDSAGLGMLLIARDEVKKRDRKLVLRAPGGQVKRIFAVTKFETLFTVEG